MHPYYLVAPPFSFDPPASRYATLHFPAKGRVRESKADGAKRVPTAWINRMNDVHPPHTHSTEPG